MALRFIETDIEISAPASAVWAVLANIEAWPDWHPFVTVVRGNLAEGERVLIEKAAGRGRTITVSQRVAFVEQGTEFRLAGKLGARGLLDNEHRFRVESIDAVSSRFLHGQAFRGFLVRLLIRRRGAASYEIFEEINEALKQRVEERGGSQDHTGP